MSYLSNGMSLEEYIANNKGCLGTACPSDELPVLIKFIDARDDLSIQVHPNDEVARKKHQSNGKTEFWYIIDAQEDACLYSGFNKKITAEEVRQHVKDNTICQVLNKEMAKKGDAFFLPAGRVHSIGSGLFLAEIQQTSDATYRLWDYNRKDANGNPRELHVNDALNVIINRNEDEINKIRYSKGKKSDNNLENCE